jgi:hypothetical protein
VSNPDDPNIDMSGTLIRTMFARKKPMKRIDEMTEHQNRVFLKVIGLRQLSRTTGMITKRSQNTLLEALSDHDLAIVSLALAQHQEQFSW